MLNELFISSEICYNFGTAYDILNPLIHTNCKTMICIDIKDDYFYELNRNDSHLPCIIEQFIMKVEQLNKSNIFNTFEDINVELLEENKFIMTIKYKNVLRNIIYYVGDGNKFTPPEIEFAKNKLDCIWWSMSYLNKSTIDYLKPKHIVVYNTRIEENQLSDYKLGSIIDSFRISPFSKKLDISFNDKYKIYQIIN
jgi:hypothetical protein